MMYETGYIFDVLRKLRIFSEIGEAFDRNDSYKKCISLTLCLFILIPNAKTCRKSGSLHLKGSAK